MFGRAISLLLAFLSLFISTACVSRDSYTRLRSDYEALQAKYDSLESANKDLVAGKTNLDAQVAQLQSDKSQVSQSYASLQAQVGSVAALQQQMQSLTNSIASLQSQRTALIPSTSEAEIVCTGSMDPKITCMDTVSLLDNVRPPEIVVGAVVGYRPTAGCPNSGKTYNIIHRVTQIRTNGGVVEFRTKGDNNTADDGCWVPFPAIAGMLLALHKGFNADMQGLLNQIWPMEAHEKQLEADLAIQKTALDSLQASYDAKLANYTAAYNSYCGGRAPCTLAPGQYAIVNSLYAETQALRSQVNAAVAKYNTGIGDLTSTAGQIKTLRNQLENLRCTKLFTCMPVPIS